MKVVDGQIYEDDEPVWDLGSFVSNSEGTLRAYKGLAADAPDKLPTYDNLETGSTAHCIDNGDYYIYHAQTKTWYKQ